MIIEHTSSNTRRQQRETCTSATEEASVKKPPRVCNERPSKNVLRRDDKTGVSRDSGGGVVEHEREQRRPGRQQRHRELWRVCDLELQNRVLEAAVCSLVACCAALSLLVRRCEGVLRCISEGRGSAALREAVVLGRAACIEYRGCSGCEVDPSRIPLRALDYSEDRWACICWLNLVCTGGVVAHDGKRKPGRNRRGERLVAGARTPSCNAISPTCLVKPTPALGPETGSSRGPEEQSLSDLLPLSL